MPKHRDIPLKIKDNYLILTLELPPTLSLGTAAQHYLYLCRHQPRIPTPDDGRSLFCANVPIDSTEAHLRTLFSNLGGGRVEKVTFEGEDISTPGTPPTAENVKKRKRSQTSIEPIEGIRTWDRPLHKTGSHAVVVFVDVESCSSTLKAIEKLRKKKGSTLPVWGEGVEDGARPPAALGIQRYLTHHNLRFPAPALLAASADAFMAAFAEREEEQKRAQAKRRQEPDEDGFVMVTRGGGGRNRPADLEELKAQLAEKEKKGKLKGFYGWQIREERKERQKELVKKFEEDRRRVEEKKRGRRFRPE